MEISAQKTSTSIVYKHSASYVAIDIVLLLLTVSAVAIGWYKSLPDIPYEKITRSDIIGAFYNGAAIGILFFLIGDKLASIPRRSKEKNDLQKTLIELESTVIRESVAARETFEEKNRLIEKLVVGRRQVILLGSPNEAIARIVPSVRNAIYAWNVYSTFGVVDDFKYPKSLRSKISSSIAEFLKNDGSKWQDVVSNLEHIQERMTDVFSHEGVYKDNYSCFKLRENWPILNFIILEFRPGRDKEVFFGFGRHPSDEVGNVFYSTDVEIIDMFERWHITLRRQEISSRVLVSETGNVVVSTSREQSI